MAGLSIKSAARTLFMALAVAAMASPAFAQSLGVGRLISPGDLAKSHTELDSIKKCIDCHDLTGGVNEDKCLDCHKEIKLPVPPREGGYHAHSTVRSKKCKDCHPDHKGRQLYMIQWEKGKRDFFNHDQTGYPLTEKHKITDCEKCHKKKTERGSVTYLGAGRDCVSCHKDVHIKTLGDKCADCHINFRSWKGMDVKLDHDKQTKYPLEGKHARVTCEKCHPKRTPGEAVFRAAGYERCVTCHKKEDVHKGALGDKCENCHGASDWKKVRFNHDKTRYPLRGKHLEQRCEVCHPAGAKGSYKVARFDSCQAEGCHDVAARGLVHGDQFKGRKCEECHTEAGWKSLLFKHESAAYKGFKLKGKHAKAECATCHRQTAETVKYKAGHVRVLYKPINTSRCDNQWCHDTPKRGAVHGVQFKDRRCDECHDESGWKPGLFKHESSSYKGYKLEGAHAKVKCQDCHYKDGAGMQVFRPIDTKRCATANCHDSEKRGAIHGRQFDAANCGDCHLMKEWKPAAFSHDSTAYRGYRLDGKHKDVKCAKCHKTDASRVLTYEGKSLPLVHYRPMAYDTCSASGCHADPHKKLFEPRKCETCHVTADWKDMTAKFNHSTSTRYPLTGKHKPAKCDSCHKNKVWKPVPMDCNACHKKDDKHKGKLGPACEECHTTANWHPKVVAHERTGFPLTETHAQLQCEDCHTKMKGDFTGLGPDCQQCHTDPHLNQMGRLCNDCHSMRSWEPHKFRHNLTGFRLEGAHRYLDCNRCHQGRVYRGRPSDCVACHAKDMFSATATALHTIYNPSNDTNCKRCHTQFTWILPKR
ncbi:MAG: hypothetical protein HZB29_04065 [Nitrospinae bacterium]|nr:hypothetical protein [Nitrospinota bacterium]